MSSVKYAGAGQFTCTFARKLTRVVSAKKKRPRVARYMSCRAGGAGISPSPGTPGDDWGEGAFPLLEEDPSPCPLPEYRERVHALIAYRTARNIITASTGPTTRTCVGRNSRKFPRPWPV